MIDVLVNALGGVVDGLAGPLLQRAKEIAQIMADAQGAGMDLLAAVAAGKSDDEVDAVKGTLQANQRRVGLALAHLEKDYAGKLDELLKIVQAAPTLASAALASRAKD